MQDTQNNVCGVALPNPSESPFYKPSEKNSGLMQLIYPAYKHKEGYTSHFTLQVASVSTPKNIHISFSKDSYHILTFGGNMFSTPQSTFVAKVLEKGKVQPIFKHPALALETETYIHAINMPGVNRKDEEISHGALLNASHCVKAAILQAEYLISKGVDPEKIILYGISLGGALSTIAAAHLHSEGKKVSVFGDRTLSSTSAAANGMIIYPLFKWVVTPYLMFRAALGYYYTPASLSLATTAMPFVYALAAYTAINCVVKCVIKATDCEMNVGDAFLSLPKYYKQLSYVPNDFVLGNIGGLYQVDNNSGRSRAYTKNKCFSDNHNASVFNLYRDSNGEDVPLYEDFKGFVAEVKARNALKQIFLNMYYEIEASNFNEKDIRIPKRIEEQPKFKNAFVKCMSDSKALIAAYKAKAGSEKSAPAKTIFTNLYSFARKAISCVYNLHEAKGKDRHLSSVEALADEILDRTVETMMGVAGADGDGYGSLFELYFPTKETQDKHSNEKHQAFVEKLRPL